MSSSDASHRDPRRKYFMAAAKRWQRYMEVLAEVAGQGRPPTPQQTRGLTRNRHAAQNAERIAADLTERMQLKHSV